MTIFDLMPHNVNPRKKFLNSDANMNLEPRESSRLQQQPLTESVLSCLENHNLKYQGNKLSPPFSDYPQELRWGADGKILVQRKSSGNHQLQYLKGKAIKDDELIKYMSKLPGFLKRVEGGQNLQDKALNVGVLDWSRLQEYRKNQIYTMASNSLATSSSLLLKTPIIKHTFSSVNQWGTHAHQNGQQQSVCPNLDSSKKDVVSRGVKPSSKMASRFQDVETSLKSSLGRQRKAPWTNKSFNRKNPDITNRKGKTKDCDQMIASEMGNLSTDLGNKGDALRIKLKVSPWDGEVEKRVEEAQVSNQNIKNLEKEIFSNSGATYPKSRSNGVSRGSKEKISAGSMPSIRTEKLQDSNVDLGREGMSGKFDNSVLLPKGLPQHSSRLDIGSAEDENFVEANQNCFSVGSFSPVKSCSAKLISDIPHLCSLRSEGESKIKPDLMAHSLTNSKHAELSSDASHSSAHSSTSSIVLSDSEDAEHNTIADDNLNLLDQEMTEMAATISGNPSPNRRFSFSLSRMGRSLSWKESSAVPRLSSSYVSFNSGPLKSEDVSCLDDSSKQKTGGQNRARSSPLRRILDPLLRSRSSNRGHPMDIVPPLKGNSSYFNLRPVFDSAPLHNKRQEPSSAQALLQLTMKNGLPSFTFVVDSNSSILAATGKDDSGLNYTFYSVNEIKKKGGGWISQGSKMKSCGFVYNVTGHMVSRSHFPNLKSQNLKIQCMVREFVLFGVELKQADHASSNFMPNKELAAVVMEVPTRSLSHEAKLTDNDMTEEGFTDYIHQFKSSSSSEGNINSFSTTVILPSGVHSLPNNGAPSPLIERWKSGGICDCGGWDVGCKLRTLTKCGQITSIACSNSDSFQLFENGVQQNRPIFTLVPLHKEIYSVEFKPSVSSLQAFFISVTVLSGQKSSSLSEVSTLHDAGVFLQEPFMNEKGTKKSTPTNIISEKLPAKCAPNPPHSPVGRV